MTGLEVRRASPDQVVDVRHEVLRPGRPRDTAVFPGDEGPEALHWVAEREGSIVGVVSVLPAPMPDPPPDALPVPALQLRGMAIVAHERRHGVGAALLERVHVEVGRSMWCNARIEVAGFYGRYGWHAIGDLFDVPLVGPHQRMWWLAPTNTPQK